MMKNWLLSLKKKDSSEEDPILTGEDSWRDSSTSTTTFTTTTTTSSTSSSGRTSASTITTSSCTNNDIDHDHTFLDEDREEDGETPCKKRKTSKDVDLDGEKQEKIPSRKRTKNARLFKFRNEWCEMTEFKNWLVQSTKPQRQKNIEFAYCRVCNCEIFPLKTDLIRHKKSEKHISNERKVKGCSSISEKMIQPKWRASKYAELKLVGLLATNNLPFLLMDTLVPLCADIFPDSDIAKGIACRRTKATAVLRHGLGKIFQDELCDNVRRPGRFFSLIMDETTDVAAIKQCAFTIIFYDETNTVKTRFLDMVSTEKGDAVSLYDCLKSTLAKHQIPLKNMIGFSSDTTNVMVGDYNSMFSHLKAELPDIVCIRCSCHMIHLAASAACLQLPRSVEDVLRNIGAHFSRSYSRQEKFKEFQNFFKTDIHKILMPSITRWLSLEQCVKRILEQFEPLCAYFRLTSFEDHSKTTETIVTTLENKYTFLYLQFMSYVLEILNDFNKMFQTQAPLLHKLKPETMRLLKTLCCNFIDKKIILKEQKNVWNINHTDPHLFVPLDKIYLGVATFETIQSMKGENTFDETEMNVFLKSCLKFYIDLVSEIKKRFRFSDPIFEMISIVDPREWASSDINSLSPIIKRLSFLKDFIDLQKIFSLKNAADQPLYPNLRIIIGSLLALPFSNVSVERIFSKLKNIKTCHRNSLKTETVAALITTSEGIADQGGCIKFTPNKKMLACDDTFGK